LTSKRNSIKFELAVTRRGLSRFIKVEVPAKYSAEKVMKVVEFDVS